MGNWYHLQKTGGLMLKLLVAASMLFAMNAFANELDNENTITNQGPEGTVVIRIDKRDGSVAIAQSNEVLISKNQAMSLLEKSNFSKVAPQNLRSELDSEAGSSSWYYVYTPYYGYNYNYGYNCLNWYGYNYYPYYNYSYGYYNYSYYGSYNRWW
jgi:hypothetical protein